MALVTFDGENRLILIEDNVTELDVRLDIYSAWKLWVQDEGANWIQAMRSVGGDPITAGQSLGGTFFLMNGWRIQPWPGVYRLLVSGNLYTEEGDDPFIPADGVDNNITINLITSNIIDLINAGFGQLQERLLDELHRIHGLNPDTPLVVDQESRTAGPDISQTITKGPGPEGEEPVTVTRDT
jgi:hypothetical protein